MHIDGWVGSDRFEYKITNRTLRGLGCLHDARQRLFMYSHGPQTAFDADASGTVHAGHMAPVEIGGASSKALIRRDHRSTACGQPHRPEYTKDSPLCDWSLDLVKKKKTRQTTSLTVFNYYCV